MNNGSLSLGGAVLTHLAKNKKSNRQQLFDCSDLLIYVADLGPLVVDVGGTENHYECT